jgi:hypothetical protein
MKKVLISLMVIGLVGGIMGTALADFSDIETSRDNYFSTGSMDLRVSNYMGQEFEDPNVPAFFNISDAWPCCSKDICIDLHNYGQGFQVDPYAYIHFKNFECYGIETKDGKLKPEPEWVAETGMNEAGDRVPVGEKADGTPVYVDGIGLDYGEDCNLNKHVDVHIWVAGPYPHDAAPMTCDEVPDIDWEPLDLSKYDTNPQNGIIKLDELECKQVFLGQIPNCNKIWVRIMLHLQDIPEAYFGLDLFDETNPLEAKWDHWPTNALMKDGMRFDMAFELLQNPAPDP